MIALLLCDEIDALVERLGNRSIEEREAATAALILRGRSIEARLRRAETTDPEVEVRIRWILENLGYFAEADCVLVVLSRRGCEITPVKRQKPRPLERERDGTFTCVLGAVRWDVRRPHAILVPRLLEGVRRPADLDLPVAFEILTTIRGFPELVPALEARKSADPALRSACDRAIRMQKEEP